MLLTDPHVDQKTVLVRPSSQQGTVGFITTDLVPFRQFTQLGPGRVHREGHNAVTRLLHKRVTMKM